MKKFKIMTTLLLLLAMIVTALVLTACNTTPKREPLDDVVLVPKTETVAIPKKTLEPCKALPKMEDRAYTQEQVLDYSKLLLEPFSDCKARKNDATDSLKKALNIK